MYYPGTTVFTVDFYRIYGGTILIPNSIFRILP